MTTVAYRAGILASDSLAVQNNTIKLPGAFRKIWRMSDGSIVGCAGDTYALLDAIASASGLKDIKSLSLYTDSSIIHIDKDENVKLQIKGIWSDLGKPEFYAIGSGAGPVLGALANGATAEQAVKAASLTDIFTDDRIQILTLGGPEIMPERAKAEFTPVSKPMNLWKCLFTRWGNL